MYRAKLYLTMLGTLAAFIGISTLAIVLIFEYVGWGIYFGLIVALFFNLLQWVISPYLIDAIYRVRPLSESEAPHIHRMVERLSAKLGLKKPKVMISNLSIPNAFAYGGVLGGSKVALTKGLLEVLEDEEVEAVIGHELGHIKHRDVLAMMFLSTLPAVFYYIYRTAWLYSMLSSSRERGGSPLVFIAVGIVSLIIYFVLSLIMLAFSRVREYYADYESAVNVADGPRKLREALAKIVTFSERRAWRARNEMGSIGSFKALLISDPDAYHERDVYAFRAYRAEDSELVERLLRRKVTLGDRILELFSTHPNIVRRLQALVELEKELKGPRFS